MGWVNEKLNSAQFSTKFQSDGRSESCRSLSTADRSLFRPGNLQDRLWGQWQLKRSYRQVFGYAQAFGSPTRATYRCSSVPGRLDPQTGLRAGVWILNRGFTRVFGVPTAATHGCLESQTVDPASCHQGRSERSERAEQCSEHFWACSGHCTLDIVRWTLYVGHQTDLGYISC